MILNNGRNFLKALKIGIVAQELEVKSQWKMGTDLEEVNAKKSVENSKVLQELEAKVP